MHHDDQRIDIYVGQEEQMAMVVRAAADGCGAGGMGWCGLGGRGDAS